MIILPIGDQPNPRSTAWVNGGLLVANVVVFALFTLPLSMQGVSPEDPLVWKYIEIVRQSVRMSPREILAGLSAYDLFVLEYGFRPSDPSLVTLFTSMFLHGGFLHLAGNMLFLWIFGDNVEARLGRLAYLGAYLGTGVAATLFHSSFFAHSPLPLVGASGAISGVLGFYFVWFPENQVRILWWFYWFVDIVLVPARWVLGFYLLIENLLPFIWGRGASGVAHGAHIGGFLAGMLLAGLLDGQRERGSVRRWLDGAGATDDVDTDPDRTAPGPLGATGGYEHVLAELSADRPVNAARQFFGLPPHERAAVPIQAVLDLAQSLDQMGHDEAALTILRQYVAVHRADPAMGVIHLAAGLLALRRRRDPTLAYAFLQMALRLDSSPVVRAQVAEAMAELEQLQGFALRRRV